MPLTISKVNLDTQPNQKNELISHNLFAKLMYKNSIISTFYMPSPSYTKN